MRAQYNIEHIYNQQVIKWQGSVVRVDSDDSGDPTTTDEMWIS